MGRFASYSSSPKPLTAFAIASQDSMMSTIRRAGHAAQSSRLVRSMSRAVYGFLTAPLVRIRSKNAGRPRALAPV